MFKPPLDPSERSAPREISWRNVAGAYGLVAVVLFAAVVRQLWTSTLSLIATAVLLVGLQRVYILTRRFSEDEMLTFSLGGKVEVTVAQLSPDEANCS
jgi:hypothetical protein